MKKLLSILLMLLAAPALAQTIAQPAAPTPPTPPIASAPAASPAQTMSLQQFLQQSLTPEKQQKLERGLVAGMLVNCVGQQSGMDAAQTFYQQVEAVGKQINADCKSGQADAARTLVLQTIDQKHADPIVGYLHGCYVQHASNMQMLDAVSQKDAANYDRWMRDPTTAQREMTDNDVCHAKGNLHV